MEVKGLNGSIELTESKIVMKRKGFTAFLGHGFKGDKEIFLNQISSIQLKKCSMLTNGYIQFAFSGGKEAKGGIVQATSDENTVMFKKKMEPDFIMLKDKIEEAITKFNSPAPKTDGALDNLEKLAKLKEQGILTEEEFTAKKKQILGL